MPKFVFTPEERDILLANLFYGAHASVQPVDTFHWHSGRASNCDTHLPHSSQALAIDFFGTLQNCDQPTINAVMQKIAASLGLRSDGEWKITLEWFEKSNLLREWTPTQVDAMAESPHAVILFEAKFCEADGGACRQPFPDTNGIKQCSGNYQMQTNPKNGVVKPCALTGKGIRYWEVIPKVMRIESLADYLPCPFASPRYQWMRNVTLAYEYAAGKKKEAGFAVVYADHAGLIFPGVLRSASWTSFVDVSRADAIKLSTFSYQSLCELAVNADTTQQPLLRQLQSWVINKIEQGGTRLRRRP